METNENKEISCLIETNLSILNEKIIEGLEEYNKYLDGLKDEKFEEKKNEPEEDAIKRAESIYDRLDEMIKRNELTNKNALETVEILNKMTELFNGIITNTNVEKEKLTVRNNELIDIIIDLEEIKTNKLIEQNPRRKNELKGVFEDKKEELNEHKIKKKETPQKQVVVPISIPLIRNLDINEMKQIEEWSGMKIGNIIFDSDVDDWKKGKSVFDQRIINKKNLIFLIEDEDDNKFGGYVNITINRYREWINDPKSFVFSLKSNERLNGMLKFDIQQPQYAFYLFNESNDCLFEIGDGDLSIFKMETKNGSICKQQSFNYNRRERAFRGKKYSERFTPKRITVIQLI